MGVWDYLMTPCGFLKTYIGQFVREGVIIGKIEQWLIETKPIPKDSPSSAGWKSAIRSAWLPNLWFYDRKSKQNGVKNYNIG